MNETKKLPTIEIGDTVVFRTDLVVNEYYGAESFEPSMVEFTDKPQLVRFVNGDYFIIENDNWSWSFTPEMVAQVIKPTKERMYSEGELKTGIREAKSGLIHEILKMYVPDGNPETFINKIKSLNTEGR